MVLSRWRRPSAVDGVQWSKVDAVPLEALLMLAEQCAAADGAARPAFRSAPPGRTGYVARAGEQVVAAVTVFSLFVPPVVEGLVHPSYRGRGLGAAVLDWGLARGGAGAIVKTGVLTAGAQRLFETRGLSPVTTLDELFLAEDRPVEVAPLPAGITLEAWDADGGYDVYAEAFADLPDDRFAFMETPGLSPADWLAEIERDDSVAAFSRLACDPDGRVVGMVVCDDTGPFQVGTVPAWRRRGLGLALVTDAIARVRDEAGQDEPWELTVSVGNTGAGALLRRVGYEFDARHGFFERSRP